MKSIKRKLISALLCLIALFVLTGCGGSSSSNKNAVGRALLSALQSKGFTNVAETEELDKTTAAYADVWESESLKYAETIKKAVEEDGEAYETAEAKAWQTMKDVVSSYWPSGYCRVYRYTIGDNETAADQAQKIAEDIMQDSVTYNKPPQSVGCATGIDYDYNKDTGEITKTNKVFVFCVYTSA